jgi:hypothetical protein
LTASIAAPSPLAPANNAQIRNLDQPVTLIVQNAITTKPGLTYTFEVATDPAFASKVQTKDAVVEGTSGQTGVRLDQLRRPRTTITPARSGGDRIVRAHLPNSRSGRRSSSDAPVPSRRPARRRHAAALRVPTRRGRPASAITQFEWPARPASTPLVTGRHHTEGVGETGSSPVACRPTSAPTGGRRDGRGEEHFQPAADFRALRPDQAATSRRSWACPSAWRSRRAPTDRRSWAASERQALCRSAASRSSTADRKVRVFDRSTQVRSPGRD